MDSMATRYKKCCKELQNGRLSKFNRFTIIADLLNVKYDLSGTNLYQMMHVQHERMVEDGGELDIYLKNTRIF